MRHRPLPARALVAIALSMLACPVVVRRLGAQSTADTSWAAVAARLQTADTPQPGYHRFNYPRRDLSVRVGDVTVAPAIALGAWVGFAGSPAQAMLMGDLVLTAEELRPVLAELARRHIDVTAIHNHLVGETPHVMYVHVHATGAALDLASRIDAALALTATPRGGPQSAPTPPVIDTSLVRQHLAISPRANGAVAQLAVQLIGDSLRVHGERVPAAMASASPINLQAVSATRWVGTGDFAVTAEQLQPLLEALAAHGITATATHSHLVDESPRLYFVHFWGDAEPGALLQGLRAAVDAARAAHAGGH